MSEINNIQKIKNVLHPAVKVSEIKLSYIDCLFPEFKNSPYIVLHKQISLLIESNTDTNISQSDEHDITGSPLKYNFNDDSFNDTIIITKTNWRKEEEQYVPLCKMEANTSLNLCIKYLYKDWTLPIFALCDSKDIKKTRLIGVNVNAGWFTRMEVCFTGLKTLSVVKKECCNSLQEHLKLSRTQEHDIKVSTFNTFDVYGTKEIINGSESVKDNFQGSISFEVIASDASLDPPTRMSTNNFIIQISTGWNHSEFKHLRMQLLLLDQYLNIIEQYKENINVKFNPVLLEFPDDFANPYKEENDMVEEHLNMLIDGDYSYRDSYFSPMKKEHLTNKDNMDHMNLKQCGKHVHFRHTLDFTDFLWELLIKITDYLKMITCIDKVFKDIQKERCVPQVNSSNSTRFAKIISNSHQQKVIPHLLTEDSLLELVIDMGFEKLSRDYIYILLNAKFVELNDIQQKLGNLSSDEFDIKNYRRKLTIMAQIHVCLEFMSFIQAQLNYSTESLQPLFNNAFKQFVSAESPIQHFRDFSKNTIYDLTTPIPISIINELSEEVATTSRITLSSQSKVSQTVTTTYCSRTPIFPITLYLTDETNQTEEEIDFYTTTAVSLSSKAI